MALSVWATVVFFKVVERRALSALVLYGLIALAGLYTQPYIIFVSLAHLIWVWCCGRGANRRDLLFLTGMPITLAALGFLPWSLWAAHQWRQAVAAYHVSHGIELRAVPMILHELTGAGYLGTGLILCLALIGFKAGWAIIGTVPFGLFIFWFQCYRPFSRTRSSRTFSRLGS